MPLYYPPSQNGLQKSLSAQLDQGVTASATLNNTTGLQNKPGVMVINRINTSEVELSASVREYIPFTGISGSTVTGLTRGAGGSTDQDHAVGSVVEFIFDITHAQAISDALANLVDTTTLAVDTTKVVTPTGTQTLTNKTLAAPIVTGDANLDTTSNIQVNSADPKRAFYIPANALMGATTNGAATGQVETSSYKVNYKVLDFDQSTEEYAILTIPSPHYWDASTVTVQFIWTAASGTGDVVWACQGVSFANDDALDTDYGTRQKVTDSLITAGDAHFTSFTSAITIAGTPTAGDLVSFRIYRIPGDAADTLNADARLIGIKIRFGIGQYDDQ